MRTMKTMKYTSLCWQTILITLVTVVIGNVTAFAETKKPNILIIWGDDIGEFNISAYNLGQMDYRTPNIDKLADQGALCEKLNKITQGRTCLYGYNSDLNEYACSQT